MDVETCFNSFSVIGKYAIYCIFSLLFGRHFIKWDYLLHRICFHFFLVISTSYHRKKKKSLKQVLMLDTTLGHGLY
jgi:hypothetical protein